MSAGAGEAPAEVETRISDGIAVIRFVRPDRRNSFTAGQVAELREALEAVEADPLVRAVILTGSGRFFNVGGTPDGAGAESRPWEAGRAALRAQLDRAVGLIRTMRRMPQPVIAAVNGGCAGAGLALALAADLRVVDERARFNTGFLAHGMPGELGAMWFATRLAGAGRARGLFLFPGKVDAADAHRAGLVDTVVPAGGLDDAAAEMARRIAAAPPAAVAAMKRNLADAERLPLEEYLAAETDRRVAVAHAARPAPPTR
ncbi:enoyl-CoA hydratase/isomerase family protein [Tomitella gaofuii]|uniref:enoyl-CoA hydratase/isomerase family protein n=1 Tax=Tomitella gaofuii TaxID=2760083 RepID=UPI0015F9B942|nr:enoyl-CoA hydratase/isomerase family protein [Tomitella gaofuii]